MVETDKSLGRRLLGFFIQYPEDKQPEPVPTAHKPKVTPASASQSAAGPIVPPMGAFGEVDRKFIDHFAELLEKANLPGPDYFEFKQALKSMAGLGLNEEKRFQASWASFKAMAAGVTDTAVLTTSANHYGNVLNKDRENFLKDVEKATDDRIGSLKQEAKKLQEDTKTHAQLIMDLQKKIDASNDRLEKIKEEIQEQTDKINTNRDSFDLTYQSMVDQINADVEKIKRYLK